MTGSASLQQYLPLIQSQIESNLVFLLQFVAFVNMDDVTILRGKEQAVEVSGTGDGLPQTPRATPLPFPGRSLAPQALLPRPRRSQQ